MNKCDDCEVRRNCMVCGKQHCFPNKHNISEKPECIVTKFNKVAGWYVCDKCKEEIDEQTKKFVEKTESETVRALRNQVTKRFYQAD